MISAAELEIGIRQTEAFVAADAETIAVTPAPGIWSDGAGGHTKLQGEPFEEVVRLIPQSDKVPVVGTWEGTRAKVEYILIAAPDAGTRLTKGSVFFWRNARWRIEQIHQKPDYEFKADVVLDVG
jgi:hypothetical protein